MSEVKSMSLSETPKPGTKRGAAVVMAERQAALYRDLASAKDAIKARDDQIASLKKQIADQAKKARSP